MVYGKHRVLCKDGAPLDRLILIKSGWVRRSRGIPFHPGSPEVVMGIGESIGVDFLGEGNCLGLEGVKHPEKWKYSASLMARTEVLELPLAAFSSDPQLRDELASAFSKFSNADDALPPTVDSVPDLRALASAEREIATAIVDGSRLPVMDT